MNRDDRVLMDRLVLNFPIEWRGLFSALDRGTESEHYAELWLTETHRSQYGDAASWSCFLKALCDDEPCSTDSKLCYCPRLLVFPLNLRRNILSFVHRYRDKFPPDDLMKLVMCMRSAQVSDDWIGALLRLIYQHCQSQPRNLKSTCDTIGPDVKPAEPIYTFSSRTQAKLKDFFMTLQSLDPSSENNPSAFEGRVKVKTEEDQSGQNEPESMDVDVDECATDIMPFSQSQYRHISFNKSQRSHFEGSFLSQRNRFLEENLQVMFDMVKELWHRQQKASNEDLQLFCLCNQDQISEVCRHLELGGASEGVLSLACEQFTGISQHISYSTAVCFANTCVLPSVLQLEESPTRTLQSTLLGYAKIFPKQSIDGVFVPCSVNTETGTSLTDLLSKVLKETFTDEHKQYYLEAFFQQCSQLSEAMLPVLQQLLDAKIRLSEDSISALVGIMETSSLVMSENLKFGKLLIAVINKYSRQLTPSHVNRLRQTVESNKTFLKRSCLAALNKLKT